MFVSDIQHVRQIKYDVLGNSSSFITWFAVPVHLASIMQSASHSYATQPKEQNHTKIEKKNTYQ